MRISPTPYPILYPSNSGKQSDFSLYYITLKIELWSVVYFLYSYSKVNIFTSLNKLEKLEDKYYLRTTLIPIVDSEPK